MAEDDKKVIVDPNLDKYNIALQNLGLEISEAINKYLKNGYVNFAAVIGVLEDSKVSIIDMVRKRIPAERAKFQKKLEPTSYIG